MKKIILTAAAVFALNFANAQETRFGIKGGLNLSDITNFDNSEMKVGFHIGGFAEVKMSDKFAFQPELLYSTQGTKSDFSETSSGITMTGSEDVKLAYLNIPLMAKYFVTEQFSLEAGPQVGFLLSAKDKFDVSGGGFSESGEEDIKDELKSMDYGVNFGLGYDFTEDISAGVRYNLGLSQLQDELDGQDASKNMVWQFSLGYKF